MLLYTNKVDETSLDKSRLSRQMQCKSKCNASKCNAKANAMQANVFACITFASKRPEYGCIMVSERKAKESIHGIGMPPGAFTASRPTDCCVTEELLCGCFLTS